MTHDLISLGPVHLEVTNPERSARFWQDIVGLELRENTGEGVELGTRDETLVVLHGGAQAPFQRGHSGLYHLAIHAPTEPDFARILARMLRQRYRIGPTDHTMSKAIYLKDPDGIEVEITLETPERLRSFQIKGGRPVAVAADGTVRDGSAPLDIQSVLSTLPAGESEAPLAIGTKVGHVHLYTANLEAAHDFYKRLGFVPANYWADLHGADLGAGGPFKHRIAINTWQGEGAPQSPPGTARMRHFTVRFESQAQLDAALHSNPAAEQRADGYLVSDPSGNKVLLTLVAR
jgi:catechol 2,3-dioxygenase